MLAGPRKLVTWIYENYYAALLNTCSGIFELYLNFWKGQKSLASLRKGLSEEGCTLLHTAGSRLSLLCVWGIYSSENAGQAGRGSWVGGGGEEEESRDLLCQRLGYQVTTAWLERTRLWTTGAFHSLCALTTKGKETKSQLSLKGTWRDSRKQRPQAKARPEGTWARGSWTSRS